jgi:hypothetical protein
MTSRVAAALAIALLSAAAARAQQSVTDAMYYFPPVCGGSSGFSDVPAGDPYCPWIKQLAADGVTQGCGGGKFCPDETVTRKQLAMLVERGMKAVYARTWIVSPVPLDPAASGQRLLQAFSVITANASTTWLVKLEPGVYDLGGQSLPLEPYVDLEGSGVDVTYLQSTRNGAIVIGADRSELRSLTVRNQGGVTTAVGVALGSMHARITDVAIDVTGTSATGVQNAGDDTVLRRLDIIAHGLAGGSSTGISIAGDARVSDVEIFASGGAVSSGVVATSGISRLDRLNISATGTSSHGVAVETGARATLDTVDAFTGSSSFGSAGLYVLDATAVVSNSAFRSGTSAFDDDAHGVQCEVSAGHEASINLRSSRMGGYHNDVEGEAGCAIHLVGSQLDLSGQIFPYGTGVITCYATVRWDDTNSNAVDECP